MSYFNKWFGIYEDLDKSFCYFLGMKFHFMFKKEREKKKYEYLINELKNFKYEILQGVQRSINTAFLHQRTFGEFKNKYYGKSVVLVGAGPTLNYFEPIEDAVYVGVNRTFLYKDISFDYLFAIDKVGLETASDSYYEGFFNYTGNNCIKFIGDQNLGKNWQIPESKLIGKNIRRYKSTSNFTPDKFTLDIESEPLGNFWTVAMQAMQFILYTNPAKVYLVGMDCNINSAGHFTGKIPNVSTRGSNVQKSDENNIINWRELKNFANIYYPDTEIISVNPVGLKGVFKDIYTDKFLDYKKGLENVN